MSVLPDVAVIMPVLNEEAYLESAVQAILDQDYPSNLRIVLALGPSIDDTNAVAEKLVSSDSRIVTVQNPTGRTPDGLNAAIALTTESVIVRVDAHSELSANYIKNAVETLNRTGADNVGGIMGAKGVTPFEQAVAAAMTSKLGVGSAAFHVGGNEGPTETVYLGVFRRSALERVGGYDPAFTRAQDWEMNFRIRSSGGVVWFNPELFVTYRPRPSLKKLSKQYFQYGQWRREVMRQHPETSRSKSSLRYFAPPVATLGAILGSVLGVLGTVSPVAWLRFGWLAPIGYAVIVLTSSVLLIKKTKQGRLYLPLVLATMQLSWGIGFIFSEKKNKQ